MVIREFFRNSTYWDTVRPRKDDIIIVSCYKSGTTLTQQIVNLLINGEREFESMRSISPWIDSGLHAPRPDQVEALPSPRFLKSHLPFEALPYHPEWRYIYLVRDGRDVCLSLFDHCKDMQTEGHRDRAGNPIDNGPDDFPSFWDQWLETGRPRWSFFENIQSWWKVKHLPNILLIHYNDLVHHKPDAVRRIAGFLGLEWSPAVGELVCRCSSLEHMKQLEMSGRFGANVVTTKATFINKGVNGRWQGLLSDRQVERYLALLSQKLEPECAAWVQHGGPVGAAPRVAPGTRID
jgi:aryl sulfotransferase